jgi:hypothetical protein
MPKLSPFQMTDGKAWAGLTTKNHIGAIWQAAPQKASNIMSRVFQTNFGQDLDSYLNQFGAKTLDRSDDFTWELIGSARRNIPLVEARLTRNGAPVSITDTPGKNQGRFFLVFEEQWFTDVNVIVGHLNELYPLQIVNDPTPDGQFWVYEVELLSADSNKFVDVDQLRPGMRFSKDWSLVEKTLSKKGGGINYVSPFTMRNTFTMIRMQDTMPGDMISRPMMTGFKDDRSGKVFTMWMQYRDYIFDTQFRQEKNRALMFATANRKDDGTYANFGKSGFIKEQGAGIRQQMEASNTIFYNDFNIKWLLNVLMDLSESKLPGDQRKFVLKTGERGAVQFHLAVEDNVLLFTPLRNMDRMYRTDGKGLSRMAYGYGGQFVEYIGPNNVEVSLSVDSMYSDRERNKIYHPDGGVAEAYRYDILDIGTSEGEPNIQKVYAKGQEDIWGYEPGLRDPFSPTGQRSRIMANSTDGYTIHRACVFGAMVKDPSRTASMIPSILSY